MWRTDRSVRVESGRRASVLGGMGRGSALRVGVCADDFEDERGDEEGEEEADDEEEETVNGEESSSDNDSASPLTPSSDSSDSDSEDKWSGESKPAAPAWTLAAEIPDDLADQEDEMEFCVDDLLSSWS